MKLQRFSIAHVALVALAGVAAGCAAAPTDASEESPQRAESLTDALQISHRLISRVADNFSCDASYDVRPAADGENRTFVARIYSDAPNCREMLVGLNTWGELYGVRFELRKTVYKRTSVSNDREDHDPPQDYRPTLIHEINPEAVPGQGE